MIVKKFIIGIGILLLAIFAVNFSFAAIHLPKLLSNGVVLQRNTTLTLKGKAAPGEKVALNFAGNDHKTQANSKGEWNFELSPQKAGGPYEMVFKGENEITVSNVLLGDVWLCSGQSNMVLPMERVKERYPEEIANADNPEIRHFFIPTTTNLEEPQKELPTGSWKETNPENVLGFSAVAYFFAKKVYEKYEVPIGLINASVGGTPIEAWIGEEGFKNFPDILETIQQNKNEKYVDSLVAASKSTPRKSADRGKIKNPKWYEEDYQPKNWYNINIPGYWEDQGVRDLNGVVWYRREIEVPKSMTGIPAKLFMGRIVDADEIYVNGEKVGNITYQYPPRRYDVPAGVLKPGKNTVVIRVTNYGGKGGFVPDKPYYLTANNQKIDLKGTWKYKVGEAFKPVKSSGGPNFSTQNQPAALYNAMVAPVINHEIKGILWYQGETNSWNPDNYHELMTALINDLRNKWNDPDLPFLYVQLANFMEVDYLPTESSWAELRYEQLQTLEVPNTAMAVAIDLGEWNDIHPLNKKDVGERLALGAFKVAYDENIVHSGPIYDSYKKEGNQYILSFKNVGSGLVSNDGDELRRFEIAGENGEFVWANAKIDGNKVIVWNNEIENPVQVRYAWADNPRDANLYNKEGLPASPFQTEKEK